MGFTQHIDIHNIGPTICPHYRIPVEVNSKYRCLVWFSLVWFLCLMAYRPLWVIQCQSLVEGK